MQTEECRSKVLRAFRFVLHSSGCQGWTRANTERLNRPPCCFTTLSEDDEVRGNGDEEGQEPAYRDSYSMVDPDEGDYARVLQIINEYLPVKEMAGRLIGVPVLRQFGLIENDKMDSFLAAVFSKCPATAEGRSKATNQQRVRKRDKARARPMRR